MPIKEQVESWLKWKSNLAVAKENELNLRKEICEHILQGKVKGSKKSSIGVYILTATAKLNIKIDSEHLETIWKELPPEEKACIKYKPSLIAAEYKKLKGKITLNRCIDSKPGTPGLELKSVTKKE